MRSAKNNGPPLSVSVMTFNLRFGLADDGPNSWSFRKKALCKLLSDFKCDFYAFQEANDFQVSFLDTTLSDHCYIGMRKPAPSFWQNNVIFYEKTWQCLANQHFFLSATPDIPSRYRDSRWPRQCTIGGFKSGNTLLTCANTHLDFAPQVQVRSAELILQRLSEKYSANPIVLMGDFNAVPGSPCYNVFTAKGNDFRRAQHPCCNGTHHGFSGKDDKGPIDWVLYRGNLELTHARVVTKSYDGFFPSDHFPIIAEFALL